MRRVMYRYLHPVRSLLLHTCGCKAEIHAFRVEEPNRKGAKIRKTSDSFSMVG